MSRETEDAEYERMLSFKVPWARAFVAKPERLTSKSTVLFGTPNHWQAGMTCYDGDHYQRAKRYAERFNAEDYDAILLDVLRKAAPGLADPDSVLEGLRRQGWTITRRSHG